MNKKFKLTDETTKNSWGVTLSRIIALKDFNNVKTGDKGGFLEKEENLSHNNDCLVSGDARVSDNAEVSGNARVSGNAVVSGDAVATVEVITFGNAFEYNITVTDKHIRIGCEQHLKSEWLNFSDREILEMDGKKALEFWRIFKPVAISLKLFDEVV